MRGNSYTDKQLLTRLKRHCVGKHLSRYTVSHPVWNTYLQRMGKDPEFSNKIQNIMAEADEWWELQGIAALKNPGYNNGMYAKLTSNKAFTKDHSSIEIEERIDKIETELEQRKRKR